MSVEVSIPTILRTHTGGEKRVTATGDTLQAVISDLESSTSTSTTKTCGSPADWTPRSQMATR